jgi:predicted CoA-binding protein
MLNEPTRARLLKICNDVKAKKSVSEMNLVWAQKNAIHDDEAAALLKAAGKYIEAADQEDTTEV